MPTGLANQDQARMWFNVLIKYSEHATAVENERIFGKAITLNLGDMMLITLPRSNTCKL